MAINVERLVVGSLGANCYIVGNDENVLVIDPGDDAYVIASHIRKRKVEYILLTHTHIDHIAALTDLKTTLPDAKVAVHSREKSFLTNPNDNLSNFLGYSFVYKKEVELLLEDNKELPFLNQKIKVLHTPGHTPGGCCFLIDNKLFSGDSLFAMSIGRTDFPGGSYQTLIDSIRSKLFTLPDETVVFPGHMEETKIGYEKKHNPFLI